MTERGTATTRGSSKVEGGKQAPDQFGAAPGEHHAAPPSSLFPLAAQEHGAEYHEHVESETGMSCQHPTCRSLEVVDEEEES